MSTIVGYLTLPTDSSDQAISLASYLTAHGIEGVAELNEVVVYLDEPSSVARIYQLRQNWDLYWVNSDANLFALPIFQKGPCSTECSGSEG